MEKEIGWLLQEKHGGKMTSAAKRDIARLKVGEPLDHIIGFVDFLGCKILVDNNVLIPRFETEFWTEQAIGQMSHVKGQMSVLDMFAGSGCIGIAVLKHAKNADVVFADSQKEVLKQIKKNCNVNKIFEGRYEIIESDVFSNVKGRPALSRAERFDYIFANPPYIPKNQPSRIRGKKTNRAVGKSKIQESVLKYEPHPALFGGADGFFYIQKFLAGAKKFLNPDGKIYMEFDTIQRNKINMLLKKFRYKRWQFHKDQYNRFRWVAVNN